MKTANSIIRSESWPTITIKVPPLLAKRFKKIMIDCDCSQRQAITAFIHAVCMGELRLEIKDECKDFSGSGQVFDKTGVFDDYRAYIKTPSNRILNPMPYSNDFINKI